MTATRRILDFGRARHRLDPGARSATLRLLADTLAVGAAGQRVVEQTGLGATVAGWGEGLEARILGRSARLPAPSAAFVNGFAIHTLEWDCVHSEAVVHAMSVVTAALGAAIDRKGGCDPEAAVEAIAVGVDIAAGLGIASSGAMRFFRPATAGILGAAAAVARIEDPDLLENALGLAYSQAAGTMQAHVEGTSALPLQIANAARGALTAVDLARSGFDGPHDWIAGPFGFFRLFEEGDITAYADRLGSRWLIGEVAIKPYPSGRASHAVLSTLVSLCEEEGIHPDRIDRIQAFVPPLIRRLVDRPWKADMSPAYARLCLPFLAALMLTDGRIDPRRFTPESFADPALAAIGARLSIQDDGNADPNALEPQRLVVQLNGGERLERFVADTLGSPKAPMSDAQARAKTDLARDLAGSVFDLRLFDDPLSYFTEPK